MLNALFDLYMHQIQGQRLYVNKVKKYFDVFISIPAITQTGWKGGRDREGGRKKEGWKGDKREVGKTEEEDRPLRHSPLCCGLAQVKRGQVNVHLTNVGATLRKHSNCILHPNLNGTRGCLRGTDRPLKPTAWTQWSNLQHGHSGHIYSMDTVVKPTAWTQWSNLQHGHSGQTYSMDTVVKPTAWTQ